MLKGGEFSLPGPFDTYQLDEIDIKTALKTALSTLRLASQNAPLPLMVILNTERLLLRRFELGDLEPLFALYRDPEIRKYYPDGTRTYFKT